MASQKELIVRIQDFFQFSRQEVQGIIAAVFIAAFIFSFRDWGAEEFDLVIGLRNFLTVLIIAAVSIIFRISCQKIYGLSQGFKAEFKIWWTGLIISLVLAFVSFGWITVILVGSMFTKFMVKQRLGEFRYGFSYNQNAVLAFWGVLGNLIVALAMAIGLYYSPSSYFFSKGLFLNIIMAFCSLLPLPQLDGLSIFFGSRFLYYVSIALVFITGGLLLSRTRAGLIIMIIVGALTGIFYLLISSEK